MIVQAILKQKLGVEQPNMIPRHLQPTACDAALEAEAELGMLLPCTIVVYQQQGKIHITAVDAARLLSIVATTSSRRRRPRFAAGLPTW